MSWLIYQLSESFVLSCRCKTIFEVSGTLKALHSKSPGPHNLHLLRGSGDKRMQHLPSNHWAPAKTDVNAELACNSSSRATVILCRWCQQRFRSFLKPGTWYATVQRKGVMYLSEALIVLKKNMFYSCFDCFVLCVAKQCIWASTFLSTPLLNISHVAYCNQISLQIVLFCCY